VKKHKAQMDPEASVCIEFITDGARRMRELLSDLLAYTRLTAQEQETVELIHFDQVFNEVLGNCKVAIEEAQAIVTSDRLPAIPGHEPHFVQLLQNLISNALKYCGEESPRIHVSAEQQDGVWRFAVKDNGLGIAPEYHQRIFGVFK